ncbi:MAG TPA: hypothetical protein VEV45_21045 [Streptosporangiaceae bacterium]|nr:hypothetical protein [Streptosporangiaceae bacterium]
MALRISDKQGVLGWIWQDGDHLTGDSAMAQRLADQYQARHGEQAYAELAKLDNGYVRASESERAD